MITSIFSKSKPINFIVVFGITLLTFFAAHFKYGDPAVLKSHGIKQVIVFCIAFSSVLILDFVVLKNKLSQKSSYEILLYALFLATIPQTMLNENIVFSNFFVLLALRRILSLRSHKDIKKKLLDAAFWIGIASLFYFWAILFVILIYAALFFNSIPGLKDWVIPVLGVVSVYVLGVCYSIVVYDDFFTVFNLRPETSLDFNIYNSLQYVVGLTLLISFGIWSSVFYIRTINSKKRDIKPGYKIILIAVLVAFSIMILSPKKEGGEFLFLFAPLAIIITNYLETIQDKWFKELFLATLILVPIGLLML
ncbi:DUF6427 family protein [Formosa sp. S-31]|uniref:DUF6427 family protein n=1 Tax=Formosa sp. S-31 TaxID=2790949 RepID=UPI003EBE1EFB